MVKKEISLVSSQLIPLEKKEVFDEVCQQIRKDLYMSGIDADEIQTDDFISLYKSLNAFVSEFIKADPERLRAFLYRVDVNENSVTEVMVNSSEQQSNQALVKTLLIRVLEKIMMRRKYRNG